MTDSAVNTAKSAGNAIKESATGKIDSEAVKDTIKKATDTAVNLAKSAKNVANDIKQPIEKAEGTIRMAIVILSIQNQKQIERIQL